MIKYIELKVAIIREGLTIKEFVKKHDMSYHRLCQTMGARED